MTIQPSTPRRIVSARPLMLILAALVALAGCDKDLFLIDPNYSVNIFKPGPKWPNEKKMLPVEREVYAKYGKPDGFRAMWTPEGKIMQGIEISERLKEVRKGKNLPPFTWMYINAGREIHFAGSGFTEHPINDQLRLVFRYGDPEDVKTQENGIVQWMFYGVGKLYKFYNGRVVEEKEFPAMGAYPKS